VAREHQHITVGSSTYPTPSSVKRPRRPRSLLHHLPHFLSQRFRTPSRPLRPSAVLPFSILFFRFSFFRSVSLQPLRNFLELARCNLQLSWNSTTTVEQRNSINLRTSARFYYTVPGPPSLSRTSTSPRHPYPPSRSSSPLRLHNAAMTTFVDLRAELEWWKNAYDAEVRRSQARIEHVRRIEEQLSRQAATLEEVTDELERWKRAYLGASPFDPPHVRQKPTPVPDPAPAPASTDDLITQLRNIRFTLQRENEERQPRKPTPEDDPITPLTNVQLLQREFGGRQPATTLPDPLLDEKRLHRMTFGADERQSPRRSTKRSCVTTPKPSECRSCHEAFPSRSQLHTHLAATGHNRRQHKTTTTPTAVASTAQSTPVPEESTSSEEPCMRCVGATIKGWGYRRTTPLLDMLGPELDPWRDVNELRVHDRQDAWSNELRVHDRQDASEDCEEAHRSDRLVSASKGRFLSVGRLGFVCL
jgi:hypothetical protein